MGSGRWSTDVYTAAEDYRAAHGKSAFAYSDGGARKAHPALDPDGVAKRESRESDEHPLSTPIAVLFDVTGSMRSVPRVLQTKLPQLLGLLTRKGYATDPHILFGGRRRHLRPGAAADRPVRVGQPDGRGSGPHRAGGWRRRAEDRIVRARHVFMARHTSLDSVEKRGRRGYLFLIGDEMPYPRVNPQEVRRFIGGELGEPISTEAIVADLRRSFDVYYLMPATAAWGGDAQILTRWRDLLGQNVLELDDLDAVCETIALTVGLGEAAIDLDEGLADLVEVGSAHHGTVGKALAPLQRGAVVRGPAPVGAAGSGNERL